MSRPFVELYIADKKVEFKEPPQINITYSHSDLHNPTVVKNSFSKTVTIDGTPHNNQIFGCFYDMRRVSTYSENSQVGGYFNPNKKVPFTLYRNGEPMETGYVKLEDVKKSGNNIQYNITLFGGLGEFLYNLQTKENGDEMKLSDLEYGYDLNMSVDRNTVYDAWKHINGIEQTNEVYDFINFAPCYNGLPKDNFTSDKVAIDVNSFQNMNPQLYNQFTISNGDYGLVDGWLIGELEKEYNEWQMKDLRSYLQRPVIRFKEIIKACCNPENNGGYLVDLDPDFFVDENPYYSNAWMTLPLLTEIEGLDETSDDELEYSDGKIIVNGGSSIGNSIKLSVPFTLSSESVTAYNEDIRRLFTGIWNRTDYIKTNTAYYVQLVAYDSNDNVVGGSKVYSFYSSVGTMDYFVYDLEYNTAVEVIDGDFEREKGAEAFIFNGYNNLGGVYTLSVDTVLQEGMYFKLVLKQSVIEEYESGWGGVLFTSMSSLGEPITDVTTYADLNINETVMYTIEEAGYRINQTTLLNSEHTPCDYFLSYLKMFNLHIWKDMYDKKIYVRQRKNYFIDEKYDIEPYVDRGDDISITPITFDSKWMTFENEMENSGKLYKNYLDEFGITYGIQKINTNYNFDSSSKNIFENNIFKSAIQCREKSRYYTDLYQSYVDDDVFYPPFCLDGIQTFLFNASGDTTEGSYITPKTTVQSINWWKEKYYDIFPKPSFVNDKNEPIDGANVLLFYNGKSELKDVEGNRIHFTITDDIPQFDLLNEGEPCWIWSQDWDVVITPYYMPIFSRYITNENGWVTHSWDFGTPKYLYIPDYTIDNTSDIYTQYWQPYIRDMYNVDTRVVECNVLLKERVIGYWLRRFYYWDGSYWILNKISDYNVTSNGTTKCEFVRVNDIQNYLQ